MMLHRKGIIFFYFLYTRDLKMENILLDKKKRYVKIVGESTSLLIVLNVQ